MRMRCPTCYSEFGLEQMLADDAAREVMGLISQLPKNTARPLVQYTGLFRPKKQALSWDRAHKLISEASELASPALLKAALDQTLEAMRAKQRSGEWTPLKNHNYLKQVIKSMPDIPEPSAAPVPPRPPVVRNDQPPPPVAGPQIEKKAYRDPEVRKQAAQSLESILAGIGAKQAEEKSKSGENDNGNERSQA